LKFVASIVVVAVDASDPVAVLTRLGAETNRLPPESTLLALVNPFCETNDAAPTTSTLPAPSDN
jgi:hypothetical protein